MQMKRFKCAVVAWTKSIDLVYSDHASGFASKTHPNVAVVFFMSVFFIHQPVQIAN